jgi:4-amino-4-deoxy-L-arabinose transferase and related glycosyltransferases of PMT family
MKFTKANNCAGWVVCAIACTVYLLTIEETVSLWDCGEFISGAYTLGVPHPPGAPLFLLIARLFIILFGDDTQTAARAVNSMSAFASGFTILFLFWTITHFARRLVQKNDEPLSNPSIVAIIGAGAVGALAYTFSDSFWYSAVEGEVYALSSFFTALVFWAILKWEQQAGKPGADRWLVFIFFMMGLSIGVHLLNLLTLPAIVMVYFFKKYKATPRNALVAFIVGCLITGFVMKFIVQYTIKGAGKLDIFFVNELGAPFFSGFAFFFILLAALLACGIRYAARKKRYHLQLGIWCSVFMLLGYSTYLTTMLRSNADPGVDMFSVDNPVKLESYLGREDYGDWPIVYGPDFTDPAPFVKTGDQYVKGKNKYELAGAKYKQDWTNTPSSHFFPRMYDNGSERQQAACYRQFTGLAPDETPTMRDNITYFTRYQAGWMYMRYFMWNFAGRQNDLQGFGNPRDSNFITGFSFVDNTLHGDQSKMPDSVRTDNKAHNRLYMLPLLLGLAGLFFQLKYNRKDWLVTALLFFMTGLAIVVYLNQSGYQPRERDYSFVGSFYAFAIWIGLGVLWTKQLIEKFTKAPVAAVSAAALCLLAVPLLMAQQEWDDHDRSGRRLAIDMARNYLESCPPNAILFTYEDNDTYPLWYAQEVEGIRKDVRVIVTNLFGSDWYMNQMRYKVNNSAPIGISFTPEQIAGDRLNVVYYTALPGFDQNKNYDLKDILKNVVASDNTRYAHMTEEGDLYHLLPVRKLSVPVNGKDSLRLDLGEKNFLLKNELAVLSVIAENNWKRPICFTNTGSLGALGLEKYTELEGMVYRLTPVDHGQGSGVNYEVAYKNIMEHFQYGNAGKKGVYFDEINRQRLNNIKLNIAQVAISLVQAGKKEEAGRVLHHFDSQVKIPYGITSSRGNFHNIVSLQFLQACYAAGEWELAHKVTTSLKKDLQQQMTYYAQLGNDDGDLVNNAWLVLQNKGGYLSNRQLYFAQDIVSSYQLLQQLDKWEQQYL